MDQDSHLPSFEKPSKWNSVLIGGIVIGAISGIPGLSLVNCCCCAGILAGGAIAVLLYKKELDAHGTYFESSDALILGILSGIVGAFIATLLGLLVYLAVGPLETKLAHTFITRLIEQLESNGSIPPGSMDQYLQELEEALSHGLTLGKVLQDLALSLIVYPIFAMIGSLIMYGIGGRKREGSTQ